MSPVNEPFHRDVVPIGLLVKTETFKIQCPIKVSDVPLGATKLNSTHRETCLKKGPGAGGNNATPLTPYAFQ